MTAKRIIFTGGGTAGHVIVNLALIPHFLEQGWQVDYIGSKNGIERELIKQFDTITYHPISTGKLRRYMSVENLKDPFRHQRRSVEHHPKTKPNVIFSSGGFVPVDRRPLVPGADHHEVADYESHARRLQKDLRRFRNGRIHQENTVHVGPINCEELFMK